MCLQILRIKTGREQKSDDVGQEMRLLPRTGNAVPPWCGCPAGRFQVSQLVVGFVQRG